MESDGNLTRQRTSEEMRSRTRKLIETYLKFPPGVREQAVHNLKARIDEQEKASNEA